MWMKMKIATHLTFLEGNTLEIYCVIRAKLVFKLILRKGTSAISDTDRGGHMPPLWILGLGSELGLPFGPVMDLHERS